MPPDPKRHVAIDDAANVPPMSSSQIGLIAMTKSSLIVATVLVCLVAMTTGADAQWYHWHLGITGIIGTTGIIGIGITGIGIIGVIGAIGNISASAAGRMSALSGGPLAVASGPIWGGNSTSDICGWSRRPTRSLPIGWRSVRPNPIEAVGIARRNGGAHHQPRLAPGPGTTAMHCGAVIPHDDIAGAPAVQISVTNSVSHRRSVEQGARDPRCRPCPRSRQHETRRRARRGHSPGYAR